jgi:hypothetical protein
MSKSKSSEKPAGSRQSSACCLVYVGLLLCLLFNPEDSGNIIIKYLSRDRSVASSKLSSPKSAILNFLLQLPVSCFLWNIGWLSLDYAAICLLHATSWFLAWLTLWPWRWGRYVLPERQLTFTGLHNIISPKVELFTVTALKASNPTVADVFMAQITGQKFMLQMYSVLFLNSVKFWPHSFNLSLSLLVCLFVCLD